MNKEQFEQVLDLLSDRIELNDGETEVLWHYLCHKSNKEIAEEILHCDESKIRRHLSNIGKKLGAENPKTRRKELQKLFQQYISKLNQRNIRYIDRPPIEDQCYEELRKPSGLIRIKAPKNMGKTLLLKTKISQYARDASYRVAIWDLGQPNDFLFESVERFTLVFCKRISSELKLPSRIKEYWDSDFSPNDNCNQYFEEYILPNLDTPLMLGLDNVDVVFPHTQVASDFLGLLRSWYESHTECWNKVRIVMAYSTDIYPALDINQSPFNVGLEVQLPEFTAEQIQEFTQLYELDFTLADIEKIMNIVGGHPYLIKKALNHFKTYRDRNLDRFLEIAVTEESIYINHLREILIALRDNHQLLPIMKQILESENPLQIDPILAFKLKSMGLIKKQGNTVKPCNRLYSLYLRDRL